MKINDDLKKEFKWGPGKEWGIRTRLIAQYIPDGSSVTDLGGSFGHLTKYVALGSYVSIDLKPWTDQTIIADFNAGEYPDIERADFVVAQGILEYINDKAEFLEKAHKYADTMILTYRKDGEDAVRVLLPVCGWNIVEERKIKPMAHSLFYCEKI